MASGSPQPALPTSDSVSSWRPKGGCIREAGRGLQDRWGPRGTTGVPGHPRHQATTQLSPFPLGLRQRQVMVSVHSA